MFLRRLAEKTSLEERTMKKKKLKFPDITKRKLLGFAVFWAVVAVFTAAASGKITWSQVIITWVTICGIQAFITLLALAVGWVKWPELNFPDAGHRAESIVEPAKPWNDPSWAQHVQDEVRLQRAGSQMGEVDLVRGD